MYMHLTFYDGSNPFVTYSKSANQIKQIYKQWSNGHKMPLEMVARIDVFSSAIGGLRIYTSGACGFSATRHQRRRKQEH